MRPSRIIAGVGYLLAFTASFLMACYFWLYDWKARPFCHKQIQNAFAIWMDDRKTNVFPNLGGHSHESMLAIRNELGGYVEWADRYRYVAGLTLNDPDDLVLLYVSEPTRWTWHGGRPPTKLQEKAWILVPLDFKLFGHRNTAILAQGELSERVAAQEFAQRLRKTLDFLKTNQRPNWRTVVAEHEGILESLASPPGL